jgi:hypothetical protein
MTHEGAGRPPGMDARRNGPTDAERSEAPNQAWAARACLGSQNTAAHAATRNATAISRA